MMKGKKWKHLIMGVTAVLTAGIIAGCGGGGGQKKGSGCTQQKLFKESISSHNHTSKNSKLLLTLSGLNK